MDEFKKLREPFPADKIHQIPRKTKSGQTIYLDYVGHAEVTDRLLEVDPRWTWEPMAVDANGAPVIANGGMWIRLTVNGVTRIGYGDAAGKSGGDAVKEIIGDAIRNAAMRFGVALDLWAKSDLSKEPEPEPVETDPIWLEATFDAIKESTTTDELDTIAGEIADRKTSGQLNPTDRTRLIDAWTKRKATL